MRRRLPSLTRPAPAASPGCNGGHVSIPMPTAAAAAAGSSEVPPPRDGEGSAAANPEEQLSSFVRFVALGEWAGNAFGTLASLWATVVLLGGFCSSIHSTDFWFGTVMIFIESIKIFSRSYKLDSQSLFGTTRALRWIFLCMLGQPQEGNQVVLVVSLFLRSIQRLGIGDIILLILSIAVFVIWIWCPPRRPNHWQIWAVGIAYVVGAAVSFISPEQRAHRSYLLSILTLIIEIMAVLMLNLRPKMIADLIRTPRGRKLISLAKVTSVLLMRYLWSLVELSSWSSDRSITLILLNIHYSKLIGSFYLLVLSLGSLQNHSASLFCRWIDAITQIYYLFDFVVSSVLIAYFSMPGLSKIIPLKEGSLLPLECLSFLLLVVSLLSGNLQIPTAVAQIGLSSLRLIYLLVYHIDYNPLPKDSSPNMVPAIAVFYVLTLCQGSLYILASFLQLLSFFPRRWLMRRCKFGGKLGAKAIDLYYEHSYATRMEMGMFGAAGSTDSFADFAVESLSSSSSSRDLQVAGLCVLHSILLERKRDDCSTQSLVLRVTSSSTAVSTLVGMLAWTEVERRHAARVTAELAGNLRISNIPCMLKLVSSLLKLAENTTNAVAVAVPNQQGVPGQQQTPLATANGEQRPWVRIWQQLEQDYWSVPEESTMLTNNLPVLGMEILEKLARDLDNCSEILKDTTNLMSKTIGLIGLATSDNKQDDALVYSSLEFLRKLATTGERIGAKLRRKLWKHPFLLTCLVRVLEDDGGSSGSPPQMWVPAMDIIAKLALNKDAAVEIGKIQVITERLLHACLRRQGSTNMYNDQSLRKVSGEALANLALWGTVNCSAILDELGYQVINDLTDMLSDDDDRYVAASLLVNICEHCRVNLLPSHPHASEHLSSALTTVMKHMMATEGKQLESLVILASQIADVNSQAFVRELESQAKSGAELVYKLLRTLNSKKVPNPEYPRMRKVIVKILISILKSCATVEKMVEEGKMEWLMKSLTKIQMSPSRVEEYIVFYGNVGVVLEDEEPLPTLVARAKEPFEHTTRTAGVPTGNHL